MFTCYICRFAVELDDTITTTSRGGCVCLRCYLVHVEDHRPLPGLLRRAVSEVVANA